VAEKAIAVTPTMLGNAGRAYKADVTSAAPFTRAAARCCNGRGRHPASTPQSPPEPRSFMTRPDRLTTDLRTKLE
jgi:hypothetical protein